MMSVTKEYRTILFAVTLKHNRLIVTNFTFTFLANKEENSFICQIQILQYRQFRAFVKTPIDFSSKRNGAKRGEKVVHRDNSNLATQLQSGTGSWVEGRGPRNVKFKGQPLVAIFLGPSSETTLFLRRKCSKGNRKFTTGLVFEYSLRAKN